MGWVTFGSSRLNTIVSMKTPVKRYCSTHAKLRAMLHSSFFPNDVRSGHTRFVRTKLGMKLVHSFLTTQPLRSARPGHTRFMSTNSTKLCAKIVHSFPTKHFLDNTATLATLTSPFTCCDSIIATTHLNSAFATAKPDGRIHTPLKLSTINNALIKKESAT